MAAARAIANKALLDAALVGSTSAAEAALNNGADIECALESGFTPLMCAASKGCPLAVELLLGVGANVEAVSRGGETALSCAAAAGCETSVGLLLEGGAQIEATDHRLDVLQVLVNRGASVNTTDIQGSTALVHAVREGHAGIATFLLEHGADLEVVGHAGETIIDIAAVGANQRVLHALLVAAVKAGQMHLVTQLVEGGADIQRKDGQGGTLLHTVAGTEHAHMVPHLASQGVPLDAVDELGDTALMIAAAQGRM
jgi:ankyrin repeat protein